MPIELNCPSCGKNLRLADEHAGKAGRCPACQATFQIPAAGPAQAPQSPFGAVPPFSSGTASSPDGASPASSAPPGNLFADQAAPNPFASTSGMQHPYATTYSAPANMYASSTPGEGYATASLILGIISIVAALPGICCGCFTLIAIPCGVVGLILSFQAPPDRRMIGMILNATGLGVAVLFFALSIGLGFFGAAVQGFK